MMTVAQVQDRRRDELLHRQVGPLVLTLIGDRDVTDIMVNSDGRVWGDAHGKGLYDTGITLAPSQVESLIGTVAAGVGTVLDAEHPIVEAEVQMAGIRCRFEGFGPPVVMRPCLAIRKPAQVLYTLEDYVRDGIVTPAYAELFQAAIRERQNILLAGATGSGKTTLGGALLNAMVTVGDPNERYVTIEDTLELQCRAANLVQLRTSAHTDMTQLVRATMRLRPDRIIIGEVRGGEALALLKAWNTGHPGGVTTIHANDAKAALTRLSSLVQEAGVPPQPELIAATINLIAFIVRTAQGRRVTELVRVDGYDPRTGFRLTAAERGEPHATMA
jgi:type IV secretion system protein TrbB